MVTLPERAGPVVAATLTATVPFPLPDDRPCTVIQLSFDTADQSHSLLEATVNDSVPPEDPV
jgi:hypothetical protein